MPGTFFGLNIGYTGLAAAQIGQDVTGQNIANAGTEGYSVQSAQQAAADSLSDLNSGTMTPPGSLGTGVVVSSINRARDQFLDAQVRDATSNQNLQSSQSDALQQVDNAFGEPSNTGINAAMSSFFNSFQDLANNPEDTGVRAATVQKGVALANVFQGVQQQLTSVKSTLDIRVGVDVQSINDDGTQIAALNVTIRQEIAQGQQPNDLLDRRDVLLDHLSGLANITTRSNSDGTVNVSIGNSILVLGTEASAVTQSSLTSAGDLTGGELAGLTQSQGQVAAYQGQLDTLAGAIVSQVNAVQSSGYALDGTTTGTNFFNPTGTTASTIAVNPALETNPGLVAAASAPIPPATTASPGDSTNAVKLAGLREATDPNPGDALYNTSIQNYYQQTVSDAGGRAAGAKTATDNAQATLAQLTQQRSSVTGVSTDQEMLNMMKYQRAYQASAQYIQTTDAMLGTLITNLFSAN